MAPLKLSTPFFFAEIVYPTNCFVFNMKKYVINETQQPIDKWVIFSDRTLRVSMHARCSPMLQGSTNAVYGQTIPAGQYIRRWSEQLKETGSVLQQAGRRNAMRDTVHRVCKAFQCSLRISIRHAKGTSNSVDNAENSSSSFKVHACKVEIIQALKIDDRAYRK